MQTLKGRTCVFAGAAGLIGRGAVKALADGRIIGHNFATEPGWGNTLGACFDYVSEWLLQKQLS